jgi:hypothetical protein
MQDNRTGLLHEIPYEITEMAKQYAAKLPRPETNQERHARERLAEEHLRKSMEPIIPRKHQGGIWYVGKEVEIDGGKFRCVSFNKSLVQLEPIAAASETLQDA